MPPPSDAPPSTGTTQSNTSRSPLLPGVYTPTPAFFDPTTEALDLDTLHTHILRLLTAGITGILLQGSNGEACHLSHAERRTITAAARRTISSSPHPTTPLLVGCGAQSTAETIELCTDAANAGADYALVLPPSYYKPLYTPRGLRDFFLAVAAASPIPVLLYNFPGAAAGTDLDSDLILALATHPNILGTKLTCGNTGKLARVAAGSKDAFLTFSGSCDFILQALVVGGDGVIGGLSNIAPRASVRCYQLFRERRWEEARIMQAVLARGDWVCIKGGVVATKAGLQVCCGYGGWARRPVPRPAEAEVEAMRGELEELWLLERFLETGGEERHGHRAEEFPQLVRLEGMLAAV